MKFISLVLILIGPIFSFASFSQIADRAENISPLLVGEKIPDAVVFDSIGEEQNLSSILAQQPTVLVVFRGSWCPYCSVQLSGLAKAEAEILRLGYQIVAISPDDLTSIPKLESKTGAGYQLYADVDAKLISALGIAFDTGGKRGVLPVPAVFVLSKKAEILFEHINPNYKVRMDPDYLISVLQALKKTDVW